MLIDKTGSNLESFKQMFLDSSGKLFRIAISESFSFAFNVVQIAQKTVPNHKLDLWDQAVQYKLAEIIESKKFFVDDVTFHLEKNDSLESWQYGISITNSLGRGGQRLWILPDGIIKTSKKVIALEFDHGKNLGKWATQLLKAVRSLASSRIDGVLYCFCLEKELHSSGYLLDPTDNFTDEFQSLLNASLFGKSLGIISMPPQEWQNPTNKKELVDFFNKIYVSNKKMITRSRESAQQILQKLL